MNDILIVDNEPAALESLKRMLEGESFGIQAAASGAEAKKLLLRDPGSLLAVLLDWTLPDVDAIGFLQWIRSEPSLADLEVIVHSEEFDPENVKNGIECGAYYYLTKPFDEPQLEAIVRAAVSTCQLRRRLVTEVEATQDAFQLLDIGRFRFRTVEEGDLLAIHIASACGQPDATLGLRELFLNAVEHGNLGITYDDKTQLVEEGNLEQERRRRLELPDYRDRRVEVTVQQVPSRMDVTVRDEGQGFEYERFLTMDEERLFDAHGRGVMMAASTLEIEYLPPGNHVRISVPIQRSK